MKLKKLLKLLLVKLTFVLICCAICFGAGRLWWECVKYDLPDAGVRLEQLRQEDPIALLRRAWVEGMGGSVMPYSVRIYVYGYVHSVIDCGEDLDRAREVYAANDVSWCCPILVVDGQELPMREARQLLGPAGGRGITLPPRRPRV